MREPADPTGREAGQETDNTPPRSDDTGATSIWQWLAIGVLLVCWLAEATLCAGGSP